MPITFSKHLSRARYKSCKQCEESFEATRAWQVFCNKKCKNAYANERRKCFYCGYTATCRDHIFPIAKRFEDLGDAPRDTMRKRTGHETVPSCWECNKTLGSSSFDTIEERLLSLAKRYLRKYPGGNIERKLTHIAEQLEYYGVPFKETQRQLDIFERRRASQIAHHGNG